MATDTNNILLQSNAFSKCAPNLSTNIKQCGTVTLCKAKPMTLGDLQNFVKSGDYLVMDALLKHEMEIAMCEAKQEDLSNFFMANKVNMSKKVKTDRYNDELYSIRPFVLAKQYSQINNAYWLVANGQANGGNWQVDVQSSANIPPDVRWFNVDERVSIRGNNAGTTTQTVWTIVSATAINNAVRLVLSSATGGSYLPAARLASPVTGVLIRLTANKNDYEKYCAEPPGLMNWKYVPFWMETMRTSMCRSQQYEEYRKTLMRDGANALYSTAGDLDTLERNKQLAADWQKRLTNQMMWGAAKSQYQNVTQYNQLPEIDAYSGGIFDAGGGTCVGFRADMIGIYEQMAQCGRVVDLDGAQLNLVSLINEMYNVKRVREANTNKPVRSIDWFVGEVLADAIMQAMVKLYNSKSDNTFRMTLDVNQPYKEGEFGFRYRSFDLTYPAGLRINVVTHYFFDDYLTANVQAGQEASGRLLWVLDMSGIYPGVIASNRKTWKTGDLATLAKIDSSYACVLETKWQEQTLTSATMTMIVECPMGNLLLEGFDGQVPSIASNGPPYPPTTTTTTTTSTAG